MTDLFQYVPYTIIIIFVGFMFYEIGKLIYGSIQDKRNGKN
jgi:hypothetical protein